VLLPALSPGQPTTSIITTPVLSGLHHRYVRI
jgi:hypothetical protein